MNKKILETIKNKLSGLEKFYSDLDTESIALYQKYFLKMLDIVDINNLTNRTQNKKYNQSKVDKDYNNLQALLDNAERDKLKSIFLHVMFEQYVWADVYKREINKEDWVKTVMYRKKIDFFPSPSVILEQYYEPDNN